MEKRQDGSSKILEEGSEMNEGIAKEKYIGFNILRLGILQVFQLFYQCSTIFCFIYKPGSEIDLQLNASNCIIQ